MSQSCIDAINVGGWPELLPSTVTPIEFRRNRPQILFIQSVKPETAIFNFVFNPPANSTNFRIEITAYQKTADGKYVLIGGAHFTELFGAFSKEFLVGEYFLCISSNRHFTGTVIGNFTGFNQEARMRHTFSHGETLSADLTIPRKPQVCDEALYFQLIDGKLPPGIRLTDLGRLIGRLPNMDCLDDSHEYSPGMNWSYMDKDYITHPWGRQWRFKVRVQIAGFTDSTSKDEEWFCIQVHNNWDYDRDNFIKNFPFKNVREIEVKEPPKPLSKMCYEPCPELVETAFVPEEIKEQPCPVCDSADVVTDVLLVPIPQQLMNIPPNAMVTWWNQNKDKDWECEAVKKFIEELRENDYFQALLAQSGFESTVKDNQGVVITADSYQNFLQLTATTVLEGVVDGRTKDDLDYQMLKWKEYQNQKLPMTVYMHHGYNLSVGELHVN